MDIYMFLIFLLIIFIAFVALTGFPVDGSIWSTSALMVLAFLGIVVLTYLGNAEMKSLENSMKYYAELHDGEIVSADDCETKGNGKYCLILDRGVNNNKTKETGVNNYWLKSSEDKNFDFLLPGYEAELKSGAIVPAKKCETKNNKKICEIDAKYLNLDKNGTIETVVDDYWENQ